MTLTRTVETLRAARKIATTAEIEGVTCLGLLRRPIQDHFGAAVADSVLQSGLNYAVVVRPRIQRIVREYPDCRTVSRVSELVKQNRVGEFLDWQHSEKINRFSALIEFFVADGIETAADLQASLMHDGFKARVRELKGIGPKTVDYLCCLVGIDAIAVDRHVRSFALRAGIESSDYEYLKLVFSYAADLLALPRRDFDAWVWHRESGNSAQKQLRLVG